MTKIQSLDDATSSWIRQDGHVTFNPLRPRQNGRRFADDTFKRIFLNENVRISIKISLKFVPNGPINNIPALVQIMARRQSGDKPLSEPMMVSLLTHICVTRPQWVKYCHPAKVSHHFSHGLMARLLQERWPHSNHLKLISPWTKWPPFCRWSFQMHFCEWKALYID